MSTQHQDLRDQVIAYCAKLGTDPLLVQGAGGNVSWKEGEVLWVKASGTWLAQALEKDIFVAVDLMHLKIAIASGDMTVTPRMVSDSTLRPSIETLLHALMPQKVVVHLHAIEMLTHLVKDDVSAQLATKLAGKISYVLAPYQKPGASLAQTVMAALQQQANTQVVFLKSHGVVVGAENVEEVERLLLILLNAMRTEPLPLVNVDQAAIANVACNGQSYKCVADVGIQQLAINSSLFEKLETNWALYPDHVVFLGARAHCFDSQEQFHQTFNGAEAMPDLVFIRDNGVYAKTGFSDAKLAQLRCYYDVVSRTEGRNLTQLDATQVAQLLHWDAEQYRMHLSR